MNTKTLALFLLVTSLSGCVNGSYSGNVQFTWTLGGLTCSNVPQVTSIAINIPGEVLQNNGVFPCLTNNYPGIVLHDFLPGTYRFTIQGLDANGTALYAADGSFTVNGDVLVSVDLSPTSAATVPAYLTWSFPANSQSPNPTCLQAGVDVVDVAIDQGATQRYSCDAGQVQPGVVSIPLNPGTHSITLAASNQSVGYPYYRLVSSLQTTAGTPVSASYGLQWAVGGVAVQWQINGSDCSNIPSVYVNFSDARRNTFLLLLLIVPLQVALVFTWKSLNRTRPHCWVAPTGVLNVYSSGMPAHGPAMPASTEKKRCDGATTALKSCRT